MLPSWGKLLVLPANVRLDWKVIASYDHSSLFGLVVSNEGKKSYNILFWLQLQLSETIIRARRFYQEVTGLKGFVHEGQVKKEAFENRFKEQHIYDGYPEVQGPVL